MSVSAVPSSPVLVAVPPPPPPSSKTGGEGKGGASAMKLGLRMPSLRPSTPRIDEFAGLDRLDRDELDEDYVPPSRKRVA